MRTTPAARLAAKFAARARGPAFVAVAGTLAAVGFSAACAQAASAQAASSQAASSQATIPGTHPSWAVPSHLVGTPAASLPVTVRVYLAGRDPAGLAAYAAAVSTPGNRSYRRYLTVTQERRRFGPTAAQVLAVENWLTAAGLRVTTATEHYIAVTGTASSAEGAFAVRLASFRTPAGGVAMAPEQEASTPSGVRTAVLTVTGLDTAPVIMRPAALPRPPDGFYRAGPCSRYYGQRRASAKPEAFGKHAPWAICGYTPAQLRGAYGLGRGKATGRGVTVAIVDAYASPTMPGDADRYAAAVGEPGFRPGQYQQIRQASFDDLGQCGASGWYVEQSLDVEAVHVMAPDANVLYVAAADCTFVPLLDALTTIVDGHLADVVSDSWSGAEQGLTPVVSNVFDQVFEEGSIEGIGFDFASGDCGYDNPRTQCGAADLASSDQVSFPTSSPWVTAVGGTTLAVGPKDNYEWETGWGDMVVSQRGNYWKPVPPGRYPGSFAAGGGGGTSTYYQQPSYQEAVVPKALATRLPSGRISPTPMREVPDVAMDADPATGFLYGETVRLRGGKFGFQLSRIGGTSLATPLFAGLEADAAERTGSHTIGFANPALYALYGTAAFHDVTDDPLGAGVRIAAARDEWADPATGTGAVQTSLYTFGMDGGARSELRATRGYDDVTGLGSPAAEFIAKVGGG